MEFSTERLSFARLQKGDEPVFLKVYSDPKVVRFVDDGSPISEEECQLWVEATLRNYESRGYGMFKILDTMTGELVGCCGIVHPGNQDVPEIKYCLLKASWGKGFATETVRGLIAYGKEVHGLADFVATVAPENRPSQSVLRKAGFRQGDSLLSDDGSETLLFYYGDSGVQSRL